MKTKRNTKGMTILEGLITIGIFSIITLVFYSVYSNGVRSILDSKRRLAAVAVANEQIEKLRNMSYSTVGFDDEATETLQGIIPGDEREQTISRGGASFTLETFINNFDDPLDGTEGGSPDDSWPNDGKEVIVRVSWGEAASQFIELSTRFTPNGIETPPGGGNLVVNVSDLIGASLSDATVRVTNLDTSEQAVCVTGSNGSCLFVGLEEKTTPRYRVSITKDDYEYFTTRDETATLDPIDDHISILEGQLQTKSYAIDRTYSITFTPREIFESDALDDVEYTVFGGRVIGTNPSDGDSTVYALVPTAKTGEATITDATPGLYFIDESSLSPNDYRYWKSDPAIVSGAFSVSLDSDGTPTAFEIIAIDTDRPGVFFSVTDGTSPLQDISVRLYDPADPTDYDHTSTTDQYGKVYFPHDEGSVLKAEEYTFEVSGTGYDSENGTVTVGSELVEEAIVLTIIP